MDGRFDAFHSLANEKKQRIINAALDEFAVKGFRKASTNAIVEQSGISKGTLFYYFGNKEELFDFLCEYTVEFVKHEYAARFAQKSKTCDFIERCKILSEIKRRFIFSHSKIIKFYESFYYPENAEYFGKYDRVITEVRSDIINSLYENLDYSLFTDNIEPEKIMTYIRWLMERYEKDMTEELKKFDGNISDSESVVMGKNVDGLFNEFYAFLGDLKKVFYK